MERRKRMTPSFQMCSERIRSVRPVYLPSWQHETVSCFLVKELQTHAVLFAPSVAERHQFLSRSFLASSDSNHTDCDWILTRFYWDIISYSMTTNNSKRPRQSHCKTSISCAHGSIWRVILTPPTKKKPSDLLLSSIFLIHECTFTFSSFELLKQ